MFCPRCRSQFPTGERCPFDGTALLRAPPPADERTEDGEAAASPPRDAARVISRDLPRTASRDLPRTPSRDLPRTPSRDVPQAPSRTAAAHDDPATIRSQDPLVGRTLGGYRIERRIGEGAMAIVYKGRHARSGQDAAIKVMRGGTHQDLPARFRREAEVVSLLKSPHTVQILDHGEADGTLFIAMEYLEGTGLDAELKHGPLEQRRTLGLLRQVCLSLAEAHALGMIHRDLKPANVFLDRRGDREQVKVLDFGIAKVTAPPARPGGAAGAGPNMLSLAQPLTAMGAIMGTPTYMAPEQARDEPLDARTDLYALGIVAYHCLAGRPPFEGAPGDVIFQHTTKTARPLPGSVSPVVAALVFRLIAKDPADRPRSADDLITELDVILEGGLDAPMVARPARGRRAVDATVEDGGPAAGARVPERRNALRMVVIAVLSVGAVVAGIVIGQRTFDTTATGAPAHPRRAPPGYVEIPLED